MAAGKKLQIALGIVLTFLLVGTMGYIAFGYPPLDAFYMTVITISTVGFGEIHQLDGFGRIFTVFLILSGVGSIAFAAGAFTELIIERASNPDRWVRGMEKKIAELEGHVIICGHGRVGAAAAEQLKKNGGKIVVIDNDDEKIKQLLDDGYFCLKGDGTREEVMLRAGIKRASALLAVLNSDPENLFAVLTARELNPVLKIIARTEQPSSESRMLRAGADSVISPFVAAGQRVAEELLHKGGTVQRDNTQRVGRRQVAELLEIKPDSRVLGKTVQEAAGLLETQILGLRRNGEDKLLPDSQEKIEAGDCLLILEGAERESLPGQSEVRKVVIVDDNPVIIRLYTRLFQKAGYLVSSAGKGGEGVERILAESPDVAVIDYHLPDMTGLQLCEKVRKAGAPAGIKLVLFTADDDEQTRVKALDAGIDRVVVKSPNAGEVIGMVADLLAEESG